MRLVTRFFLLLMLLTSAAVQAAPPHFHETFADEINQLAKLLDASRYEEVLERGEALLVRVRNSWPAGSYDEAKIRGFLTHAFYRSSRVMEPEAIAMAETGAHMMEALLGPDHPELAVSLMHLGNLYSRRWEGPRAIPYYEKARTILAAAGPDFDTQRAIILSSEGVAYRRTAENKKALELFGQALAIQERVLGSDHPDLAATLNNQAVVHSEFGDYSRAARLHRQALAIREKHFGPDHEWVGESAHNLANQLSYLGHYDEALALGERAVAIFAKQLGTDHQRYWWATENLGITYLDMGDHTRALPVLERALAGLEQRYGQTNPNLCYALDALASCRYEMGEPEVALALYTRSLALANAAYGQGSYETADTIVQQGKCLVALNRLDDALACLNSSLGIWQEYLEQDNALLCDLLNRLADLHLLRFEPERALAHASRSSELCRRDLGETHPLLARSSLLEARAHRDLGDRDQALSLALQAETISRDHLLQTMPVLSENLALDYAGSRVDGLDVALCVLEDGDAGAPVERVWDAVVRSRSLVLDQYTLRNRLISRSADPVVAALVDSSRMLRERLANLTLRGPGWEEVDLYHQLLWDADESLQDVERQLSLGQVDYRQRLAEKSAGLEQVAAALPTAGALVAFKQCTDRAGDHHYKVFILAPGLEGPVVLDLGPATRIDAAVAAWRDQVTLGVRQVVPGQEPGGAEMVTRGFVKVARGPEDQLRSYLTAGEDLRRLVWDPVAVHLGGAKTVFLVAEGSLHLANFSCLPGEDGRFLVEEGPSLHLLTSEKSLIRSAVRQAGTGRLVALGGADYQMEAQVPAAALRQEGVPGSELGQVRFSPLPHAGAEVGRIAAIWSGQDGQAVLLTGPEATEQRLKAELPATQVLHLATHGFFLAGDAAGGGAGGWDNPLVRSGLALAGANSWHRSSGGNDGILTAQEVAALDLTSVQWAVLSACDTGLGDLDGRGEGVFGLRRAFSLAGAGTVIMSLWAVDDAASRMWMDALYRSRWQEGLSTAAAVRQASLSVLDRRRASGQSTHPYYWAGFVAAGDWH